MNRGTPKPKIAWLGVCLLLAGCQGLQTAAPKSVPPSEFFQANSPKSESPIQLASFTTDEPPAPQKTPDESSKTAPGAKIEEGLKTDVKDPGAPAADRPATSDLPLPAPSCHPMGIYGPGDVPRELAKIVIPDYIIEPPDILLVEAIPSLPDQPVQGEHLVRPDGTINLGTYGSVRVAGLTLEEARKVIKERLSTYIKSVKLNVDVFAYNSKVIYIVADGAGFGEQVIRIPFTGNETVLDAIGQIGGLPTVSSKKKIWVARPGPDDSIQTLPVDWKAITQDGLVRTNYQLFPGDRIYIQSDRLMALDGVVTKIVTPIERVFGMTYLGAQTIFRLQNMGRGALGGSAGF
jgi:polysaccharide export outer membrane protein